MRSCRVWLFLTVLMMVPWLGLAQETPGGPPAGEEAVSDSQDGGPGPSAPEGRTSGGPPTEPPREGENPEEGEDPDDTGDENSEPDKVFRCTGCGFENDEAGDCPACNAPLAEVRGTAAGSSSPQVNVEGKVELSTPEGGIISGDINLGH